MHPTERGLLDAIIAEPDDDTPRLIYADWLDENGRGERAEFIRAQCLLASLRDLTCERTGTVYLGYGKYTPRCRCKVCKLKRREYMTSRRYINWEWEAPIGAYNEWRCGFVDFCSVEWIMWQRTGPCAASCHPIRQVQLRIEHPRFVLRNMEPIGHGDVFHWSAASLSHPANSLPDELFTRLRGEVSSASFAGGPAFCYYPSKDAALADLSRACIQWAREQAATVCLQ